MVNTLHVDSVLKSFGTKQILTDIFISCQTGMITGLLGRNGTGKSTLLQIIFGTMTADRKFVKINDTVIKSTFDRRKYLKYLPQKSFLPEHISIKTAIRLFCDQINSNLVENHDFIKPLLNRKSRQLSGGERRLVEVFLIVFSDALFVLLDEPFNGIAPLYRTEIKRVIKEQANRKGFIITDHDYRNILDLSTNIILLHDGGTKVIKNESELVDLGYIPKRR